MHANVAAVAHALEVCAFGDGLLLGTREHGQTFEAVKHYIYMTGRVVVVLCPNIRDHLTTKKLVIHAQIIILIPIILMRALVRGVQQYGMIGHEHGQVDRAVICLCQMIVDAIQIETELITENPQSLHVHVGEHRRDATRNF